MKKVEILCIAIAFILLLPCGCTRTAKQSGGPEAAPYQFTDSLGAKVSLPAKPQKVAVLFSSYAELWQLAGGTADITVGESVERGFADRSAQLVDSGAGKTIDNELLISYQPDFVICSADIAAQKETAELLRQNGIPAAAFRVESFEDYLTVLKICTEITGSPDAYRIHGSGQKAQIDEILEQAAQYAAAEHKKILFIRAGSAYNATKAKTAAENFVCKMLKELGTYNIAENAPILLDGLSFEEILSENPDYIFFTFMGKEDAARTYVESLLQEPPWKTLTAVQNGNYAFLPKELFHFKPNANWAEAYRYLARLLYPGLV